MWQTPRFCPGADDSTHSIVVPVYNAEQNLPHLFAKLAQIVPTFSQSYELILVNDCSTDRSWEVICQLVESSHWVIGINLMRNYGQHNTLLCGIRAVSLLSPFNCTFTSGTCRGNGTAENTHNTEDRSNCVSLEFPLA